MSQNSQTMNEHTASLGLLRWVQMAYVFVALFLFWLLDKLGTSVWQKFAEPSEGVVSGVALVVAAAGVLWLYQRPAVQKFTTEVVAELARVSWPTRAETTAATVVVIITSLIAAAIVGGYDAVWSFLTDYIYKV
jgi:preprotein translocase subunit SecE